MRSLVHDILHYIYTKLFLDMNRIKYRQSVYADNEVMMISSIMNKIYK